MVLIQSTHKNKDCSVEQSLLNSIETEDNSVGDTRVARFSVCTETTYKGTAGIVIDCCWFQVSAWESEKITCLDQIEKGKAVRVSGRVRGRRYTDNEGIERQCWEVMAREVEIMVRRDDETRRQNQDSTDER